MHRSLGVAAVLWMIGPAAGCTRDPGLDRSTHPRPLGADPGPTGLDPSEPHPKGTDLPAAMPRLAVPDGAAARAIVEGVLARVEKGDLDGALTTICDTSAIGHARARAIFETARARRGLRVSRVEPTWVGSEPFFFVEAADGDSWRHGFGVRVRDGCLDRAVGAAPDPDPSEAGEIDL